VELVAVQLLLDTHTLLWWLDGDRRLSRRARTEITRTTNRVLVSAATAWEITTKHRIGKLPGAAAVAGDVAGAVASQGFTALDITLVHAQRAGRLPSPHRDPFDRMLAAQAQVDDLTLVTDDPVFASLGVNLLW
jgi:PIN domain nuclease of toxin-antitoxin system